MPAYPSPEAAPKVPVPADDEAREIVGVRCWEMIMRARDRDADDLEHDSEVLRRVAERIARELEQAPRISRSAS